MNNLVQTGYDESEAQEILRLAGVARRRLDFYSREDLVRAAAELDIPEEAIIRAEQLVKERQSEFDDRSEFRRAKVRELSKSIGIGGPLVLLFVFGHALTFFGNFFSIGKGFLKPLGAVFFSKSTQSELDFQDWRSKRFTRAHYGTGRSCPNTFHLLAECLTWSFHYKTAKRNEPSLESKLEGIDRLMQRGMSRTEAESIYMGVAPSEPTGQTVEH
jgi:hypothetical protein